MEIINKPDLKVFASEAKSGEIATFPDVLRGWGITFEQTQGKPPLEWMNDAFNRVDLNNLYLLQQGIAEWQKEIRYPKNAVVKKDNKVYICLEENENNEPNKFSEKWGDLFGDKRDLDDNVFHGFLQVHADEDIGTGVFLICPDGKVRGQMVYNNYGLQFAQVQEDGTSQTFTFPRYGNGGEIVTDRTLLESIPVGTVQAFIGENAPNEKWLLCRGQAFSASVYPDLAKLLPSLKIPDLRGVALRGLDTGRGFDPGRALLSYQEDAMQKIASSISMRVTTASSGANKGAIVAVEQGKFIAQTEESGGWNSIQMTSVSKQNSTILDFNSSRVTRTNTQNETVMKNVAVNFIIKAK